MSNLASKMVLKNETEQEVSVPTLREQDKFFDTEHLKADLKGRSVRGGAVTMTAQGVRFILQMCSTVVLARLLTPQDFGLIAMVTAVTRFVVMFKDMGLSMATVQKAEINHGQISTLFWINVALSLGVMLVTAALAPVVAWFYVEPRLTWITLALAGVFVFGGLTVQHQALLRRNMRFGSLALIGIIEMVVGIVAAIIAAWYGAGYWSLVLMQLAGAIAGAIAVWVACGWRPGPPVRRSGVRPMLRFGGYLFGHDFLNYFFRNLDKILVGRFSGQFSLGLYSKACGLLLLPLNQLHAPVSAVVVPALSRLQKDSTKYKQFYLRAVYFMSFVTMPVYIFIFTHTEETIRLVLGNQWLQASHFFRILCVAAIYRPVASTTGWLYMSSGRTNKMFRWRLSTIWLSVCLYIVGVYVGGAEGVAYGHTISVLVLTIPCVWYAQRGTDIGTVNVLKVTIRPLFSGILAGMCSMLVYVRISNLFVSFLSMIVSYLLFTCILALSFAPIKDIYNLNKYYLFKKSE